MKRYSLVITTAALAAAMVLGTGCAEKSGVETSETVISQTSTEETTKTPEIMVKTPETTEQAAEAEEIYHMLQRAVAKMTEDGTVFTLQADGGRGHDISQSDTRDVKVEIDKNVQIAIAYIEKPLDRPENVILVIALPEQEEWSILTEKGTTTANVMSSFTIGTDNGQELSFLRGNCLVEERALVGDSGDKVTVTYMNSQGVNYPMEIKGAK